MPILLTGAAGFIGFHITKALLDRGEQVVGIDNLNDYYDVGLKQALLAARPSRFTFAKLMWPIGTTSCARQATAICDHPSGGRPGSLSLENPYAYVDANVMGTLVMFEAARRIDGLTAITYASSSSVYGANRQQPFSVDDRVDQPVSLYAATKRSCELLAHTYSHLYGLPATGLRFFTVYGPWGRPDMAAYLFTDAILAGRPIKVFNHGRMARDFTYIDDIVAGTIAAHDRPPANGVGHRIYNLGNHRPEKLLDFIAVIERALGRTARKELLLQPGDVPSFADIQRRAAISASTEDTIRSARRFIAWFKYHRLIDHRPPLMERGFAVIGLGYVGLSALAWPGNVRRSSASTSRATDRGAARGRHHRK
jgi:UDP-glucuronate 4-epimerase